MPEQKGKSAACRTRQRDDASGHSDLGLLPSLLESQPSQPAMCHPASEHHMGKLTIFPMREDATEEGGDGTGRTEKCPTRRECLASNMHEFFTSCVRRSRKQATSE
jgi:hypothetical protein